MSLQNTPNSERVHIAFFGKRNAGKSTLINGLTNQDVSIVSSLPGTTTDPVRKAMELLPIGPVLLIDTPGIDDQGQLGTLRVEKTKEILDMSNIAILVVDSTLGITKWEERLLRLFKEKEIPYIVSYTKSDLLKNDINLKENEILVSGKEKENLHELKELMGRFARLNHKEKFLLEGLVSKNDLVLLVIPIDKAAPKGRLILPQQQILREILDIGANALICKESELSEALNKLKNVPNLVITDSQVFGKVSKEISDNIPLTSFSIIFARYKGDLDLLLKGATTIDSLKEGDRILICEGCTHHRQCDDIGTVKIPDWVLNYTKKKIHFDFTSGNDYPSSLDSYALVVHCGGCMLSEKQMKNRLNLAKEKNIPITNYGMLIAHINQILKRSIRVFK